MSSELLTVICCERARLADYSVSVFAKLATFEDDDTDNVTG